jgi:hemerythrin superfamily protein
MSTLRTDLTETDDVIDILVRQHSEIRDLFLTTLRSTGAERAEAFGQLVRLLAVHETAEQEIVHPLARRTLPGGEGIVEDRLHEEHQADTMLAELDGMDPDDPRFEPMLERLRADVMTHARAEERYEFTRLSAEFTDAQRRGLAAALRAAQAMAPTHPHPGVERPAANLMAGPFLALADRVRDMIRDAMK